MENEELTDLSNRLRVVEMDLARHVSGCEQRWERQEEKLDSIEENGAKLAKSFSEYTIQCGEERVEQAKELGEISAKLTAKENLDTGKNAGAWNIFLIAGMVMAMIGNIVAVGIALSK